MRAPALPHMHPHAYPHGYEPQHAAGSQSTVHDVGPGDGIQVVRLDDKCAYP